MIRLLVALFLASLMWSGPCRAETDYAAIAKASLNEAIRPGYAALAETTATLDAKVAALCKDPSADALKDAKGAFAGAVDAWSKVEIFRFGPIVADHRYERLFFWPDPKSLGLRQIEDVLAKTDESVTAPATLAAKSVALQGLPALEYLLYGDGADGLAKGSNAAFRCRFAASVAANIASIAKDVDAGWRDGASFATSFLAPSPTDPAYHAPKEVTLELFKSFATGIELVRDQKLGKPLGTSPPVAKPKLAAFWRSNLAFANMIGNLQGVRLLFAKGGFAQVVAADSPGVEDSILFDLDHAIEVLGGMDKPFAEVAADETLRAKLEALRVSLKSAGQTAGDIIARSAGLSFGFNAMDGD
ncbi:MAG TPA: imelysin family protein [Methyloceanibacter sp.]